MEPTTWQIIAPWVNRVGMVIVFLSFFLAAPEIVGEQRFSILERPVENVLEFITKHTVVSTAASSALIGLLTNAITGYVRGQATEPWAIIALSTVIAVPVALLLLFIVQRAFLGLEMLLDILKDDSQLRLRYLRIGVVLFILGSIMQFVATFA